MNISCFSVASKPSPFYEKLCKFTKGGLSLIQGECVFEVINLIPEGERLDYMLLGWVAKINAIVVWTWIAKT